MKKEYLLTPGPTPIPAEVLLSMARPIIHHRTPEFRSLLKEVNEGLKYILQTRNEVLTFASSGTGAMEAAVANLLSPGELAIVVRGGKFGERFGEICQAYGIEVIPIDVEWGKPVEPQTIAELLTTNRGKAGGKVGQIRAVFATLCETSTGVVNDIKAIGQIVKGYQAVLVVDAISGLGAIDLQTDDWYVDVAIAGSQKGLMIPPGLAFLSISPKAWKLVEGSKFPKYYFDFKKARKALQAQDTPFTPAVSLVVALNESLKIIRQEGLDKVLERHRKLAEATRAAVRALGLELFAPTAPSDAVTAVKVPPGVDGEKLVRLLREKYGVTFAGGQAELKGKIFRIAHLGYMVQFDILVAISALEMALGELGYKFELGIGLKAAEKIFLDSY